MVNFSGVHQKHLTDSDQIDNLIHAASNNSNIWNKLIHISGGKLNKEKCFYYFINPKFNYKTRTIRYINMPKEQHITIQPQSTEPPHKIEQLHPNMARRTLGAMLAPSGNPRHL